MAKQIEKVEKVIDPSNITWNRVRQELESDGCPMTIEGIAAGLLCDKHNDMDSPRVDKEFRLRVSQLLLLMFEAGEIVRSRLPGKHGKTYQYWIEEKG